MAKEKIIVVDDDDFMRDSLTEALARPAYRVEAYAKPEDAVAAAADGGASLLLTDLRMPGMGGMEVLERVRKADPKLPVVVMTAFATVETAVQAMKNGAFDYVLKPFKADQIEVVCEKALAHRRLLAENDYLKDELAKRFAAADFVGDSGAMKNVFEEIRRIAASSATVFIRGESGTGKELVARSIHRQSPRRDKPLVRVNCAALSAGVLESELFGHEKGAFTGADRRRIGRFELADGGTLFLDEVSEMDLALQGKLLRVLQEKEFERVGSSETITVDVRILASSNRDLEESIAAGGFRQDLYYRLNVVTVDLPPLRERREDVRPLAEYFVRRLNREEGAKIRRIPEEAFRLLESYDWPGNVRELQNIVERALVLGSGDELDVRVIAQSLAKSPGKLGAAPAAASAGIVAAVPAAAHAGGGLGPLEDVEREHIRRTLAHFDGARAKTADALGISERSLRDRIKRWQDAGIWRE
jgi:DNA-binding NtrC family response regulator